MKHFSDYGPPTDSPMDPRNAPTDAEEWYENTKACLESAQDYIRKALRVLEAERYPDIVVTTAMDDAIIELGGIVPVERLS
jgi:DnaJ-domain-containing protein 1